MGKKDDLLIYERSGYYLLIRKLSHGKRYSAKVQNRKPQLYYKKKIRAPAIIIVISHAHYCHHD